MTSTLTDASPRVSTLDRPALMDLARTEYERFASLLQRLGADDWRQPTECPGWDVRAMAGHTLGMTEMAASIRESMRQQRKAGKSGGLLIDALTALQVTEHADMTSTEVVDRFAVVGPKAARARRRTPGFIRHRKMPGSQLVGDQEELWTLGFLLDTILTRDPWMHRIDISRATGREPELTTDHDAVIVADVAAEWAGRHGQPVRLILIGPVGGQWSFGTGGQTMTLDAIEFCRTVSGRESGVGLLATQVPF